MSLQFLHPNYLWFLFILLIPIIIHLFNFKRYKKIYFSNLRFLQNLNIENKKKSRLKNLLILLIRILALACIVIAFAQPFKTTSNKNLSHRNDNELINIYIDNSFSMNGETEKGNALEVAKNNGFELVKSLPDYSKIRIYSNDINHYSNTLNKNQAIARIQEIAPSPASIKLSEVIKNIKIDLSTSKAQAYVLSDFQKSQADFINIKSDSLLNIVFVKLSIQPSNNLVLDSCWFENPIFNTDSPKELFVKLTNHSNKDLKSKPIHLTVNDSIKTVKSIDIDKNSSQITSLRYTDNNTQHVHAEVNIEDYPISFDNHLYYSYRNRNNYQILSVNQNSENKYINNLFASDGNFEIRNIGKSELHKESLYQYQLVVLNEIENIESGFNQKLKNYLRNGGNVLFIPGDNVLSANSFLTDINAPGFNEMDTTKQRISKVELNSNIYNEVFLDLKDNVRLPDIFKYYKLSDTNNATQENLWETAGGENLFSKSKFGNGYCYVLSFNLHPNWTNLTTHPLLVPSIINLCRTSSAKNKIYYIIGENESITIETLPEDNNDEQFHIKNTQIDVDIIAQRTAGADQSAQLQTRGQIKYAENYNISLNHTIIQKCSYNFSRRESQLEHHKLSEIESKIKALNQDYSVISSEKMKLSELNHEKRNGRQFWRIFILLAFIFFLIEGLLKSKLTYTRK
ncbi:BatA domain-containing protein [Marinifilum sp.]|uniref:BatA domain-containing protein n=1 Tax=Marinifilum sp. TaxID=2033137 RepID=UPI003BAA94AB